MPDSTTILRRAIRERRLVRVTPRERDESIHGYPLVLTRDLLLLHQVDDFRLDGFAVLPSENVERARCGRYETKCDQILDGEGIKRQVRRESPVRGLPVELNWVSLFSHLKKRDTHVIVETEPLARKSARGETMFYLGLIVGVADDQVRIVSYNALGKWDRRPTAVFFDRLSVVQFDTHYANVFSRHVSTPPTSKR
jgi:hypothetical protein